MSVKVIATQVPEPVAGQVSYVTLQLTSDFQCPVPLSFGVQIPVHGATSIKDAVQKGLSALEIAVQQLTDGVQEAHREHPEGGA